MELRERDVQSGKKYRYEEREVLHQTDKGGVVGAVGVVVDALEFLDKEMRNDHHSRSAVNYYRDPALGQLAADRIGSFGYTDSRKKTARAVVLEIVRKVSRGENGFEIAAGKAVFQLVEQVERNLRLQITNHQLCFAVSADGHLLKFEVGRFHPPTNHRHIDAQRLGKALA